MACGQLPVHMFPFVFCLLRTSMRCCLINVALLCMALHGLCYILWLSAEHHVALGEAQAAPSGAALLHITQQPALRAQHDATLSLAGGQDRAAPIGPAVLGSPHLGQSTPLHRPVSPVDVAMQAVRHANRALEAANAAAESARLYLIERTAAQKALGALQALPPALLHVPLASFTQPMAAAATPGAVNGHGSRELLTQAPLGPASGVAPTPSPSAALLPFPPPSDLAALAAASRQRRQPIPSIDELPLSSQHAAAGHQAMHTSGAEADHPGLSAAGLPLLTTKHARPFASGRSGAAQPLLPAGASPRTPHAAVER